MDRELSRIPSRRWARILPLVFITYSLAYLDRANFGFGTAGGMARDLNISGSDSSLLASLFFLGYFFFQVPGILYAAKRSARKLVFYSLLAWGLLAMATGLVSNLALLVVIRFLLGVAESAVFPAMLLLLSRWFTKAERSRANTLLIFGNPVTILWMSVLSGYLVARLGWRWMFIWEGVPALIWAFFWWRKIEDRPSEAGWMPEEEKQFLQAALQKEQQGLRGFNSYREAFLSKGVILLCLQYALWSVGVYGFVLWLPSIIKSAPDMSMVRTGWLSAIPYLAAIGLMYLSSWYSDRSGKRFVFIWPFLLIGSLAFYGSYRAGADAFWISFVLLTIAAAAMYAPYGSFFASITELLPANVAGPAMALINSFGALGSFAGSYGVGYLNDKTGGFGASYIVMAGSLLMAAILTLLLRRQFQQRIPSG